MLDEEDQDLIDKEDFLDGIDDFEKEWLLDQLAEYRQEMDNNFDRRRMSPAPRHLELEKSFLYRENKKGAYRPGGIQDSSSQTSSTKMASENLFFLTD